MWLSVLGWRGADNNLRRSKRDDKFVQAVIANDFAHVVGVGGRRLRDFTVRTCIHMFITFSGCWGAESCSNVAKAGRWGIVLCSFVPGPVQNTYYQVLRIILEETTHRRYCCLSRMRPTSGTPTRRSSLPLGCGEATTYIDRVTASSAGGCGNTTTVKPLLVSKGVHFLRSPTLVVSLWCISVIGGPCRRFSSIRCVHCSGILTLLL